MTTVRRFRASRLRGDLVGLRHWPAFAVFTVGDGLILHLLPPGPAGAPLVPSILVAAFGNLVLVGAAAPWIARWLAARPGPSPRTAAGPGGRAGIAPGAPGPAYEALVGRTVLAVLAAGALGLLAAGLASRPLIVSETPATEANARTVRGYVLAHGTAEERRNLDTAHTHRVEEGVFRTCLARDDRRRASCFHVDTRTQPPRLRRDPSPAPNQERFGPGGRR